jgi:para-nitrobenzyl esterase
LTLNIWTPDPGAAGLPVMVWIYGGAYRFGSSADPGFDGAVLARAGVVVVTANHRVGVEGYAELGGAPPNRALLDQMAALRWVQEEIKAFGGDPARVTVFGESAGAGAIAALMVMPLAGDLFTQAIAHSVPGTYFSPDLARGISSELTAPLGLKPKVAALADVPPERLLEAMAQLNRRMPFVNRWGPFSPVVDGELLPTDPWTGLAAGAGHDVHSWSGTTATSAGCFLSSVAWSVRSRTKWRARRWSFSGQVMTPLVACERPTRTPPPKSCTSSRIPTGCSACRACTSRPRRPPVAAAPISAS